MGVRERIWIGIDVGKATHHACAVDETGKVVFSRKVPNGQAEIEALIARAGNAALRVTWAVDITSGASALLLALLLRKSRPVTYVPGRLVNQMAGAFAGEGKTDAKDARTIAETARLRGDLATSPYPMTIASIYKPTVPPSWSITTTVVSEEAPDLAPGPM